MLTEQIAGLLKRSYPAEPHKRSVTRDDQRSRVSHRIAEMVFRIWSKTARIKGLAKSGLRHYLGFLTYATLSNDTAFSTLKGVNLETPDEIDLMELAITTAESWKILLFVPLFAVIVVSLILRFSTQQFVSEVTVALSAGSYQALVTAGSVDAVLGFPLDDGADTNLQIDPRSFKISARNAVTGLVIVSCISSDASRAQKRLSAFLARMNLLIVASSDASANEIQAKLKAYARQTDLLERIVVFSTRDASSSTQNSVDRQVSGIAESGLKLTDQIRDNQIAIARMEVELADLRKQPVSPAAPLGMPHTRNIMLTLLASFVLSAIVSMMFVFARGAVRRARRDSEFSSKLVRLKRAF